MIPMVLGMLLIYGRGISDLESLDGSLSRMVHVYGKRNKLGSDAIRAVDDLQQAQVSFIYSKRKEDQAKFLKKKTESLAIAEKSVSDYLDMAGEFAKANLPIAQKALSKWVEVDHQIERLVGEERFDAALDLSLTQAVPLQESFRKILDACYESSGSKMSAEAETGFKTYDRARWELAVITIIVAAFALGFAWFLSSINARFVEIVQQLSKASETAQKTSHQMSASSENLTKSVSQQASAVQQTVASMTQMTGMLTQSSSNAASCKDLSKEANEKAKIGSETMQEMGQSMSSIESVNGKLQNMITIIREISSKTKVINDIVFKTQLLSFNASIEAASAGQHGRGFAVIAGEVGNLAQLSGTAAQEIEGLLKNSERDVEQILKDTGERIKEGRIVVDRAVKIFNNITEDINSISEQSQVISDATREQEEGVKQATQAMTMIDQAITQSSEAAADAEHVSVALSDHSASIAKISSTIRKLILGSAKV